MIVTISYINTSVSLSVVLWCFPCCSVTAFNFFLSFILLNPLSDCVSPIHLNFDALIIRDFPYVPWVLFDLFNSYSFVLIVLKHILYQILEFITHWMRSSHSKNRPIVFPFSLVDHRIEVIILFSFTKWDKANY